MARLSTNKRAELPDSAFAYIDSRGRRRLPINDESHVRNALSRFNQVKFEDESSRERARERLLKAAKKYGIVPIGFMTGQIKSERQATKRVMTDLKEAHIIQSNLLPSWPGDVPNYAVRGVSRPSRNVGGDWYDYVRYPDGRVAVVLADVAGKGLGAGLLMSSTRSIVRLVAGRGGSPGAVLADVNRILVKDLPAAKFITMIYALLDPKGRSVTLASAGHLPPVLVDSAGARAMRTKPQLPLGIKDISYTEHEITLGSRERLFLYSDGVVEARNKAAEEFGEERLLQYAASTSASADGLLDAVYSFMGNRLPGDDITIVSIEGV